MKSKIITATTPEDFQVQMDAFLKTIPNGHQEMHFQINNAISSLVQPNPDLLEVEASSMLQYTALIIY